jgi:hypothetical protein
LEIEAVQVTDKGMYKLVAKNEKGEATSQLVEVTDIPEEEEKKPKGEKPKIAKGLQSVVGYKLAFLNSAFTKIKLTFLLDTTVDATLRYIFLYSHFVLYI